MSTYQLIIDLFGCYALTHLAMKVIDLLDRNGKERSR